MGSLCQCRPPAFTCGRRTCCLPQVVLACVTRDSGAGVLHNRRGAEGHFLLWRSSVQTRSPRPASLPAFHVALAARACQLARAKSQPLPRVRGRTNMHAKEKNLRCQSRPLRSGAGLTLARLPHCRCASCSSSLDVGERHFFFFFFASSMCK